MPGRLIYDILKGSGGEGGRGMEGGSEAQSSQDCVKTASRLDLSSIVNTWHMVKTTI